MTARRIIPTICLMALTGCGNPAPGPTPPQPVENPLQAGPDGLGGSHADALRLFPGVYEVEVLVPAAHPTRRVIHVRDWHFVPRDLYALDLRQAAGRPLGDRDVDDRFREFLREVDAVQQDQELILAALATRHGLRRVLVEGLTPEGVANYREVLAGFKGLEDRLTRLREENATLGQRSPDLDRQIEGMA